jgi:hypothetical protein
MLFLVGGWSLVISVVCAVTRSRSFAVRKRSRKLEQIPFGREPRVEFEHLSTRTGAAEAEHQCLEGCQ